MNWAEPYSLTDRLLLDMDCYKAESICDEPKHSKELRFHWNCHTLPPSLLTGIVQHFGWCFYSFSFWSWMKGLLTLSQWQTCYLVSFTVPDVDSLDVVTIWQSQSSCSSLCAKVTQPAAGCCLTFNGQVDRERYWCSQLTPSKKQRKLSIFPKCPTSALNQIHIARKQVNKKKHSEN